MRPLGNGRLWRGRWSRAGARRSGGRGAAWRAVLTVFAAALLGAGLAPGARAQTGPPELIVRLPGGEIVPGLDALAGLAAAHDLVVLGEIHDNPRHQALQAELIRRLAPAGLAFEMLKSADAPALNRMRAEGASEQALAAAAEAGGWAACLPAMRAAPGVPVAGGGLSRDRLRQAIAESAAAAIGPALQEAALQEAGLQEVGSPALDPELFALATPPDAAEQAQVEAELAEAHCGALPDAMLPGMAEAQRLRDAAFAAALLRARGMFFARTRTAVDAGARLQAQPDSGARGPARAGSGAGNRARTDADAQGRARERSVVAGGAGDGGSGSGAGREQASPGPAVLVAGDGHARRDRGVPAYLGRAAPGLSTLAVAMVEWPAGVSSADDWRAALAPWAPNGGPAEAAPFDVVVITARAVRGDPCAGFARPAQE